MHSNGDPCNAGSIIAVLYSDVLTLRAWNILIDGEGKIVTIASHGLFPCCSSLHVLGVVSVDLGDLATLFDHISFKRWNKRLSITRWILTKVFEAP